MIFNFNFNHKKDNAGDFVGTGLDSNGTGLDPPPDFNLEEEEAWSSWRGFPPSARYSHSSFCCAGATR
ncbi:hypothetical protein MtrunA17_Chr4g0009091 [Medicago truncatula]|uniref:Uncharacterized protein n=1 Tax=Medicago truncatula TaxID=3880 RepID=A0A396I2J9_MEDTR|nr:hypothetical protein MtrunA17_Chr4g0009091 [Medicago truncatula]